MTSHEGKCDLSSILPLSCHQRAQAFAATLRSRLTSLDSEDLNTAPHESTWLSTHKDSVAISQPKLSTDYNLTPNFYLNFVSPASPVEETLNSSEDSFLSISSHQNLDHLVGHVTSQYDSDSSDGPFYDCQGDSTLSKAEVSLRKQQNQKEERLANGETTMTENTTHSEVDVNNEHISNCKDFEPQSSKLESECNEISGDSESVNRKNSLDDKNIDRENSFKIVEDKDNLIETQNDQNCLTEEHHKIIENLNDKVEENLRIFENLNDKNSLVNENHIRSDILTNGTNDDNETEEQIPRVRRCSSLKTGKTPPGTPGQKKIVRFADVFGLDLADIRTFLDEIPKIPNSAFNDLSNVDIKLSQKDLHIDNGTSEKILVPLFQQPGSLLNFVDRLRESNVCLDCAMVEDPTTCLIKGVVKVKNLDFHKSVHVRYTSDCWKTFADVQAVYMENSCDGFSDRFSFMLYANNVQVGDKLEFAVRFQCKGCQYWDNNNGINYIFQCLPGTSNGPSAAIAALDDSLSMFY